MKLKRIKYADLRTDQRTTYNFQRLSGILAEHGFLMQRFSSAWGTSEAVATYFNGENLIRIKLTSRLTFWRRFVKKKFYVAFCEGGHWYFYKHDKLLRELEADGRVTHTYSWQRRGIWSSKNITEPLYPFLEKYRLD